MLFWEEETCLERVTKINVLCNNNRREAQRKELLQQPFYPSRESTVELNQQSHLDGGLKLLQPVNDSFESTSYSCVNLVQASVTSCELLQQKLRHCARYCNISSCHTVRPNKKTAVDAVTFHTRCSHVGSFSAFLLWKYNGPTPRYSVI